MEQNKTSKYLKYAIGEIVLVVIGILIALSINNWNERKKEEQQLVNIYMRVVKDFENSAAEIEIVVKGMDIRFPIMRQLIREEVDRDSLLSDMNYFQKYNSSSSGFHDIQIHDNGVRMLETKIGLNYGLNNEYSEALILLYSELLYEIEVDRASLIDFLTLLNQYETKKGLRPVNIVNDGIIRSVDMILEDDVYKNHLLNYFLVYGLYRDKLKKFKAQGEVLMDKIKSEYNLE